MCRKLSMFCFLISILVLAGCNLEGRVVSYDGTGLEGVTVSLSGSATAEVITNSDGCYVFNDLKSGDYTVNPKLDGYRFTPSDKRVEVKDKDVTGVDFEALPENFIRVPQDYSTIQEAVDAASKDGTVLISDGAYSGSGNYYIIVSKRMTIRSVNGPEKTIIDCQGKGRGFLLNTSATISGLTITNGFHDYGGGIKGSGYSVIENCIIKNNHSTYSGGGVSYDYGRVLLENCIIEENTAGTSGGGINASHADVTVKGGEIRLNRSDYGGGGASLSYGECELNGVSITQNSAKHSGGGLSRGYGSLLMKNCKVRSNHSDSVGGGAVVSYGTQEIVNSLFDGNVAKDEGAGISFGFSNPVFLNCTVTGNISTRETDASGIYVFGSSSTMCEIANCIVWGNGGVQMDLKESGPLSVSFSNIGQNGVPGEGNINADPLFSDSLYRLSAGSPCVDSGKDTGLANDLDDVWRPQGNGFDMGAYEYVVSE